MGVGAADGGRLAAAEPGPGGSGFRRVLAGLRIPHPQRVRLARELAADLAGLVRELEARGWSGEEARRKAEVMLLPSGAALDALERVHRPLYRRLTDRFAPDRMRSWERIVLVGLSCFGVVAALRALAATDPLVEPSPFLVPVLVLGVAAIAGAAAKAFQLFVKREHDLASIDAGLPAVLALAVLTAVAGVAGFVLDLFAVAALMETGPPDPGRAIRAAVHREAILALSALTLSLLAGLLWYLLLQWVAGVEAAEQELARHDTTFTDLEPETSP